MIVRRTVGADGTLPGLAEMAGEEVVIVRARTEKVAKAFERSIAVLEDVRRYVAEHRDLMRRQMVDFTGRYGNPAEKALAYADKYAKHLTSDEIKSRVHEVNDLVEKRLETIQKDLERRYEDLEREVEGTIERIFASPKKAEDVSAAPAAPSGPAPADATANATSAAADAAKPKRSRGPSA